MINWPAFIKYHGDDELLYIDKATIWLLSLSHSHYDTDDRLIDSSGMIYALHHSNEDQQTKLTPLNKHCSVETFCGYLKAHFLCLKHCCVSKFHIKTFSEGMLMLQKSDEADP